MGIPGPGPATGPFPGEGRTDAPSGEPKGRVPATAAGDAQVPASRAAVPLPPSISSHINTLKLPPGPWSASILACAKFFSLPLEGNFLNLIRHRALEALNRSALKPGPVQGGPGENAAGAEHSAEFRGEFREALSLAALAAHAKGVELSPEALAEYARALLRGRDSPVDGDADPPADKGATGDGASGANGGSTADEDSAGDGGTASNAGDRNPDQKPGGGAAQGRALGERILGAQGPLLSLLNRLPGKGGKRWIVLPFSTDDSLECCLRILLAPQAGPPAYRAERLGLDIRHRGEAGPAWTFLLRPGEATETREAALEVWSTQTGTEALEGELAGLLDLPPGSVRVREGQVSDFAEDSRDRILPSINKEV
jgi:hypothetical protein